jgi:fused signal recognition particle receptor
MEIVILAVVIAVVVLGAISGLVVGTRRKKQLPPPPPAAPDITAPPAEPHVGDEAETPRDEERRTIEEVDLPGGGATAVEEPPVVEELPPTAIEVPEPTAGRLVRLRARLSRSQNALGKGLLTLLSREHLDDDTWEEIEDTLLTADVGVQPTQELVEGLRERVKVLGTRTPAELRGLLRDELLKLVGTDVDRTVKTEPADRKPGIVMVVGVNGTGKTTTTGKLARVLVADGRTVVLGAADTFRAAAADQRLAGREAADHFRAERLRAHRVDEVLHHRQRDVGLEQRDAHFAQRVLDVRFGEARFAADRLDDLRETSGERVQHGVN